MELLPTVDFKDIKDVKDLPVSWISTNGRDIDVVGAYELQCKQSGKNADPQKISELLGGDIVHLKQTTLGNGLRFVNIHKEDGTQIFDEHEYGGLITCNCGAIHDSPSVRSAKVIDGTDLGDGFKLSMTVSGHSKGYGSTASFVNKEFFINGKEIKVWYCVEPENKHEAGHLVFHYEIKTPGTVTFEVKNLSNGGRIEERVEPIIAKYVKAEIRTAFTNETDGKNSPYCQSSFQVAYNLPKTSWTALFDQVEFNFGIDGRMIEAVGISQGDKPNPEWTSELILKTIKKGSGEWFRYPGRHPSANLLVRAVTRSQNIDIQHNTRDSLAILLDAAIREIDIDLAKTLVFI